MREILFKAKRIDNGEWVTGTPVFVEEYTDMYWWDSEEQLLRYTSVGRTTLCQFTGLTDKNGVKIFEGDILNVVCKWDRANMVVLFESCTFVLKTSDDIGYKYLGYMNNLEIIGNIHDNPDLLTT